MNALRWWLLGSMVCASVLATGCPSERYYCDATGCYFCDGAGCRLAPPADRGACRSDSECGTGSICTSAGCVENCTSDASCPTGTVCRTLTDGSRLCLGPTENPPTATPGTCTRTSECGAGAICINGRCGTDTRACAQMRVRCECSATQACDPGFSCVSGECRPSSTACQFNAECPSGRVCRNGQCTAMCGAGTSCPTGQVCTSGLCVDVPSMTGACTSNAQCGSGKICIDSVCYDACSADAACGTGRYCNNGRCVPDDRRAPPCSASTCRGTSVCVNGICRTPCASDMQCALTDGTVPYCRQNYCSTLNQVSSDCGPERACSSTRVCIDGVCR